MLSTETHMSVAEMLVQINQRKKRGGMTRKKLMTRVGKKECRY